MGYKPYGFDALTNQNAASTQAMNMQPTMPGYTGLDSMTFDQMRTPEDQIHWLYLYVTNISLNIMSREEIQALIDSANEALKAYVDSQMGDISQEIADKYNYLLNLIKTLTQFNGTTFDPTVGDLQPIAATIEHVYDFDRPFSVTAIDYDTCGFTAFFYDSQTYSARDFDVCFALLTYDFYSTLVRNGVAFTRNEDTLILIEGGK